MPGDGSGSLESQAGPNNPINSAPKGKRAALGPKPETRKNKQHQPQISGFFTGGEKIDPNDVSLSAAKEWLEEGAIDKDVYDQIVSVNSASKKRRT